MFLLDNTSPDVLYCIDELIILNRWGDVVQNILSWNEENKKFYKTLIFLCIPIIIQNLISNSVNVIDTVMVSNLGEKSIAAVGVANQFFFLFAMVTGGIFSGSGIFISQFYGKGDYENIKKTNALSVTLGLVFGLLFAIPAIFFPETIIHFFTYDETVVDLCSSYLKIVGFSYPITCISLAFSNSSRSIRNPKLGMICSLVALLSNTILNYLFIFGNFGAPNLGVSGAAIATLIARILECALMVSYVYFYKKDYVLKFKLKDMKNINKKFISSFFDKSSPVIINDATWALGTVLYSVAYSKAGTSAIAASQIATSVQNFFIMTSVCIAIGSSIMIGNELGANNKKIAIDYAKKFSVLISIVGSIFGIILYLNIPLLLRLFSVSSGLSGDISNIFIVMGLFMGLRAFNIFLIVGMLRSGGDTKFSLFLELGCMWLFSIPLTFLAAYNGAPVYILVLISYTEEITKFIFGIPRAISKKWANNIVENM